MSDAGLWLTAVGMGVVTFATRLLPIALLERMRLPALVQRGLRFVPPAVLSAIVFPELLVRDGALDVSPGNARLIAGLVAALVAWRTRNVIATIVVGMATLWLLQAITG
jgi:branched-subunit amino acid transport protein